MSKTTKTAFVTHRTSIDDMQFKPGMVSGRHIRVPFRCSKWQVSSSALMLILSASSLAAATTQQSGYVRTGATPIASSTVTIYEAGSFKNAPPTTLGKATTDATGFFNIPFNAPSDSNAVLYVIADGGNIATVRHSNSRLAGAIRLATVLGAAPVQGGIVINERTTAASAYAMAQFIDGLEIAGKAPGLQNAAATVRSLVDLSSGQVGSVLGNPPNGSTTSTLREFNSLANLLASCINASTPAPCLALFRLAAPPSDNAPQDTLQAAVDIAHFPSQNAQKSFKQSRLSTVYTPALALAPTAWTLAIRYNGNGHELDGPGNMAFDKDGNIWSTNNYDFNSDPRESVCGSNMLIKLTPTGEDAPGAPYSGGGVNGAGFGITLDPNGDVWVGNFGFQGQGCTENSPGKSVSEFRPDGTPVSPDTTPVYSGGFQDGHISQPQATVSDQSGNIWIANCGSDSVTQYRNGNPENRNFSGIGVVAPFGIAIDAEGNAWITGNTSDSVAALAPDGSPGRPFVAGASQRRSGSQWIAKITFG
ncbi:MAG: hypothetical protein ACJ74Z_09145 [Bryobacteraceae bacterium]|jgi:hypothetical protein